MPFIATEDLLMEAVKRGGDRQDLHETIRKCSMEATIIMKNGGDCDLVKRLAASGRFYMSEEEMVDMLEPKKYIGRCVTQVEAFLDKHADLFKNVEVQQEEIDI